jgi:transcriptional accessory protein Tex/SPT6
MKDKGLVWQVEYQTRKLFKTESEARSFYKKTWDKENLISTSIKHRVYDTADRIVSRIMTKIYGHLDLGRTLNKLTITEQKRIKRVLTKIAAEILEELLK